MFVSSIMRYSLIYLVAICWLVSDADAEEIDFNREIRPILSDKCYFCHGPDDNDRQAGLRLDVRDAAIDVIEVGEFLSRVHESDPDLIMPPPKTNLSLTAAEKKLLTAWVEQGAPYADHWSFTPLPESVAVPELESDSFSRGPIDRFVLSQIRTSGLNPTPAANPLRWLRRVTLDLTGLPPTTGEISAFERDIQKHNADEAYERAAERLVNSKAFGEHMAVAWLDAVRYADSYGYQSDKLNTQWPYRDWVVRAFNNNLPYDQFLTWQLAGDLLPDASEEQKLATAFNRIHRLNNEGGAVFEEWRIENVADRVHTFGTAVLGLTLECSRCHDHKYDPISARDYYSLSAFFNSIDESGVYDRTEKVPCPSMLLPTESQAAALDAARKQLAVTEAAYDSVREDALLRFQQRNNLRKVHADSIPDLKLALGFDHPFDNSIKTIYHPSQSDRAWASPVELVPVEVSDVARLPNPLATDDPMVANADTPRKPKPENEKSPNDAGRPQAESTQALPRLAMKLDGERGVTINGIEPFDRWMSFSVVISMRDTERSPLRSVIAHHTRGTDCGYNGWDLAITDGYLDVRMARVWPGNAISVRSTEQIPKDQWCQVATTYDGSSTAQGIRLFVNGKELPTEILRDELKKQCNVQVDHGGQFVIGQRFRDRGFTGGLIDDARVYLRDLTVLELACVYDGQSRAVDFKTFVSAIDVQSRQALAKLTTARKNVVMAEEAMQEIPNMRELESPRPAHVLARGQYDAPTDDTTLVTRNVPLHSVIPLPNDDVIDRRTLAKWVTDPKHPLTARVAVNRLWGNFFGNGLVGTPENFGLQGDTPSHPRLLDWLARDFVASGWDVKRFCKNIVLSSTYRQDSKATPEAIEADPENQLLSRGPSHRLSAEQIRDLVLAASDAMSPVLGGPPVSPYQPGEDLWRESNGMSPPYRQSVGKDLYRRSLYSVWKRTAPLPNMLAFDASTREVCMVKRSRTNTPLQALVLLNDVQFVEAARLLAADTLTKTANQSNECIVDAFLRSTGRLPTDAESVLLNELYEAELEHYRSRPEAATAYLSHGESKVPDSLPRPELAAMTVVCQAIFNLDATIWKR